MPSLQSKTLLTAASTGYVVTLADDAAGVSITARAECFVRVTGRGAVPTAPTSAAIPTTGSTTDYVHLLADETVTFGVDTFYENGGPALQDRVLYVLVWAVGAGYLTVAAH